MTNDLPFNHSKVHFSPKSFAGVDIAAKRWSQPLLWSQLSVWTAESVSGDSQLTCKEKQQHLNYMDLKKKSRVIVLGLS